MTSVNSVVKSSFFIAALVAVIVFIAFIPALRNGFVDYDDTDNFLRNQHYRGLGAEQLEWMWMPRVPFFMGHYHPLTWMTLGFDYIWGGWVFGSDQKNGYGMDPRAYHLTSNVIHAINAALVFLIALKLLGDQPPLSGRERDGVWVEGAGRQASARGRVSVKKEPSSLPSPSGRGGRSPSPLGRGVRGEGSTETPRGAVPPSPQLSPEGRGSDSPPLSRRGGWLIAAFVALLWGLHPLRVESVAWITERRDLVNAFFALLSVLAYLRAARVESAPAKRRLWLILAYLLFVASLLGKVMTVTLPVVFLVMDWFPLKRLALPRFWSDPRSRAALLEKIPFLLTTALFIWLGARGQAGGGWLLPWEQYGLAPRLAVSCYGLVFYLVKTLWPAVLLPIYEIHLLDLSALEPRFLLAAAIVVAGSIAAVALARRRPAVAAAAACYAIILSPVIGLVQNGNQIAADRYTYLAMIPWMIALGAGAAALMPRLANRAARRVLIACAGAVLVALGALCWRQCLVWRSTESLWTHVAHHDPGSSYGQNSYGFVLLEKGRVDEAIPHLREAIRINDNNYRAHVNLWTALERAGDLAEAEAAATAALANPIVAPHAHYKLGNLRLMAPAPDPATRRRLAEEARQHLEATITARPGDAAAHNDLAISLQRLGRTDEAMAQYRMAIDLKPTLPNPRQGLAILLNQLGRRDEAIAALHELLAIQPGYPPAKELLEQLQNAR